MHFSPRETRELLKYRYKALRVDKNVDKYGDKMMVVSAVSLAKGNSLRTIYLKDEWWAQLTKIEAFLTYGCY